jgi:hypothetical protein
MHSGKNPIFQDGFRSDEEDPEAEYVVFTERLGRQKGLFFLHGALHLYSVNGELRKRCWSRTGMPLTALIKTGLAQREYPLFVAEGLANKKLEQIQRSPYLWYCLDKLACIKSPLVVFGHSLGESDRHIRDVLARNETLDTLYISVRGDPNSVCASRGRVATSLRVAQAALHVEGKRLGGRSGSVARERAQCAPILRRAGVLSHDAVLVVESLEACTRCFGAA